jgi:ABC-type transporter Mla subunit MlaD
MADAYNEEELSPRELRQLIASNARAIEALGQRVEQINEALGQRIDQTNETIDRLAQATNADITRLAQLMEQFFHYQGSTNVFMQGALERHEERLHRLETEETQE